MQGSAFRACARGCLPGDHCDGDDDGMMLDVVDDDFMMLDVDDNLL